LIIKRKNVVAGGGHHGGAWKVAYADFVTAMMAFFLLMWLLNATTEEQKKGLADYFAPSIPISRTSGGADGMFGGDAISAIAAAAANATSTTAGPAGTAANPASESSAEVAAELAALHLLEEALLGRSGESARMDELLQHVVTRLTDEGLIIEIFARPQAPIFDDLRSDPLPVLNDIIGMVAELSQMVTNPVAVSAHLPTRSVVLAENPVWPLSTARANAVRALLEDMGLDPARISRVTGHADRHPVVQDPAAPRNDRIEIIFLRRN
jgi:chemotaxis protein MotB